MKNVFESIMTGLNEAIEDAQSEDKKLSRQTVTYQSERGRYRRNIKRIRDYRGG